MISYAYVLTDTKFDSIHPKKLSNEIDAAITPDVCHIDVTGTAISVCFEASLDPADKTAMDGVVAAHEGKAKKLKYKAIDKRTDELIAAGFTYGGKQFSLAATAQMKMVGTHEVKDDPALTYPIEWNTIDDNDTISLADATDLHNFYLTGVGTMRATLDSGTALKGLVRVATTKAEIDAVVDPR